MKNKNPASSPVQTDLVRVQESEAREAFATAARHVAVVTLLLNVAFAVQELVRLPDEFLLLAAPKLATLAVLIAFYLTLRTAWGIRNVVVSSFGALLLISPLIVWQSVVLDEAFVAPFGAVLTAMVSATYLPWPVRMHIVVCVGSAATVLLSAWARSSALTDEPVALGSLVVIGTSAFLSYASARQRQRLRSAEASLRESEERFRQLAEHSRDIIWIWEPSGGVEFINTALEEFTGSSVETLFDNSTDVLEIIHPNDRLQFGEALQEVGRGIPQS